MDTYKEFGDRLRNLVGKQSISICQGIVKSVGELTCTVRIDNIDIPDVRLRASMVETNREVVLIPKPGSAVIVGSLNGDLTELALLACDELEEVRISGQIILNGGQNGGLINVKELTNALNRLVNDFNTHTHTGNQGSPTSPPVKQSVTFNAQDYEDTQMTH